MVLCIVDMTRVFVLMRYKSMYRNQKIIKIANILEVVNHIDGLQVIIFDMDDTLYSEKEYIKSGYHEISKIFPNPEYTEKRLWQLFCEGDKAIDEYLVQENQFTQELKEKCLNIYRFQVPDIHLYDGVGEMLKELKKQHQLGLITDGRPEGQKAKIEVLELEGVFDEIIITDELGGSKFRKPNPKSFQIIAERFHADYNQMCYIGDNIAKDFIAPQRLGMKCIWYENLDGLYTVK